MECDLAGDPVSTAAAMPNTEFEMSAWMLVG